MEQKIYRPVSCAFYDELTLLALRKKQVSIAYLDSDGHVVHTADVIADIFTKKKKEYVVLNDGTQIRLDDIISLEGKPSTEFK